MKRVFLFWFLLLFVINFASAKDYDPFFAVWKTDLPLMETPSNSGIIGYFETPSARIMQDGHLRIGYSQIKPHTFYYFTLGLLPRVEAGLRLADIYKLDVRVIAPDFTEKFGSYKDESPHVKFLLIKEGALLPSVALGATDFLGTGLFKSAYIVATKYNPYIIPMDISVGYGKKFLDGFFAGGEVFIHPRLSFLWEYSSANYGYEIEALRITAKVSKNSKRYKKIREAFPKRKSKYNFGVKLNFSKIFQTILSYQYGDAFGFNVAFNWRLGEPWLPHIERGFQLKGSAEDFIKKYNLSYEDFISYGLYKLGFRNISVYTKGNCLCIDLQNRGYLSNGKAILKVFELIRDYPPSKNVKYVEVVLKSAYFPVVSYKESIKRIMREPLDFSFLDEKNFSLGGITYPPERVYPIYTKRFKWGYNLKLDTKLADKTGYFAYKWKILVGSTFYISKTIEAVGSLSIPLYKNITLKSKPYEKIPVRSDFIYYFNNMNPYLDILKLVYFDSFTKNQFLNVQAGLLEPMFAGLGADAFYVFKNGIFALGAGFDIVKKRDPKSTFDFVYKDKTFKDAFIDFYLYIPWFNVKTVTTFARFLGGDKGVRFTFSRSWKGFELGAWYTYSDSKGFKNVWNKGHRDYGFFIGIPFRMFEIKDTPRRGILALSLFNRDIGQLVERGTSIDRVYKYTPAYIMNNLY